ncbi:PD-(D/E)XK motif protein [Azotobacter salinestris]|uniref:PD-(D/E)XK motif protein n=1 Tax=Azotobacter salinestris TaxID=69964 RepID=UPI0032DE7B0F
MKTTMTTMHKASLEARWEALTPDHSRPVFQLVDATHPLEFYIGKDPSGKLLILLVTDDHANVVRQMRHVQIDVFAREDGRWSLLIRLSNPELAPIFCLLCEDLISSSRSLGKSSGHVAHMMGRIALWQRLLERNGAGLLSPSEVRGLVGELAFLLRKMVPAYGEKIAVESWEGPFGADQDFRLSDCAWEIKTIRPDAQSVRISSAEQLHSTSRAITLVTISLSEVEDDNGTYFSLNSLVAQARQVFSATPDAAAAFDACLVEAKYIARKEYDTPLFVIQGLRSYRVKEGFPRVCRSQLHTGILDVSYDLSLVACNPYLIEE